MLIAVLDLRTTAADRPAALAQLDGESDEIRAMPGNLDFRVYADRDDDGAVTVLHDGPTSRRSPPTSPPSAFARSGAVLRPLMTARRSAVASAPRCSRRSDGRPL